MSAEDVLLQCFEDWDSDFGKTDSFAKYIVETNFLLIFKNTLLTKATGPFSLLCSR